MKAVADHRASVIPVIEASVFSAPPLHSSTAVMRVFQGLPLTKPLKTRQQAYLAPDTWPGYARRPGGHRNPSVHDPLALCGTVLRWHPAQISVFMELMSRILPLSNIVL